MRFRSRSRAAIIRITMIGTWLGVSSIACKDSPAAPRVEESRLEALTPLAVEGRAGEPAKPIPTVMVKDAAGNPLAGVTVRFWLTDELSGTVTSPVAITDNGGIASAGEWVLGSRVGIQRLISFVPFGRQLEFQATVSPGAPATLESFYSHEQAGLTGAEVHPPAVVVRDQFGNGVAGIDVSFTITAGDGLLEGGDVVTDKFGYAQAKKWTLGTDPGQNEATARVLDLVSVTQVAQALDPERIVLYDLDAVNDSAPELFRIKDGSLALSENGYFVTETRRLGDNGSVSSSGFNSGTYEIHPLGLDTLVILNYAQNYQENGDRRGDFITIFSSCDYEEYFVSPICDAWRYKRRVTPRV